MKIKKACAIFTEIESDEFGDLEKLYAIKEVLDMETHNGISKEEILNAFKWMFNLAVDLSEDENATRADRIRGMSDEELAEFILHNCDNPMQEVNEDVCDYCDKYEDEKQECNDEGCTKAIVKWLKSKAEG